MRLVIEDVAGTRSVVPFASDEITLGRARDGNTFRLEDRNVSRRHARLVRASGAVYIEDLGSLTGTRVNGERITGRRRLREGDLVEIGAYDLALLPEEDHPGAPPALRPTPAPGGGGPGATGPGTPAPPQSNAEVVAPAAPPDEVAAVPAPEPVSTAVPAPPRTAAPAPRSAPEPARTAPPFAATATATTTAAALAVPSPTAPAATPSMPAPSSVQAPRPSPPMPAPPGSPGALGRALLAGAVALALGFGAGWAVGVIAAREPPPAGEAPSAR